MFSRFGAGVLKGLILGGVIGAGLHFGLGWSVASGLFGYLLSMGVGATAGIICGKPPWKRGVWIESVLKAVFGLGVGAATYWALSTYANVGLWFDLPGASEGTRLMDLPLVALPIIGALYGAFVELDNTGDDASGTSKQNVRVGASSELAEENMFEEASADKTGHA